jgi:hypothetical protein
MFTRVGALQKSVDNPHQRWCSGARRKKQNVVPTQSREWTILDI